MVHIKIFTPLSLILSVCLAMVTAPTMVDAQSAEAQALVDKMTESFNHQSADPNMGWFRDNIKKAKAVMILRQFRAGFIIGASGGSGVMMAQGQDGQWSHPAFYGTGSGSIGFQIGAEGSEVALLVMTEKGRDALLTTDVKLGGDLTVAAGPVGAGATVATTDVLAFSRSKGVYGGVSLEGTVIGPKSKLNHEYYGQEVSPLDILVNHKVQNPGALELVAAVTKMANMDK
jgi:lipid-binding SYLF domain-containing protein